MSAMDHIHAGQPVIAAGASLQDAHAALVLVHGRGAGAESMLPLANEFDAPGFAFLAPQAAAGTWYPQSFMAPFEANQPHLDSALRTVGDVVAQIEATGIAAEKIALLGFSQGACLALEYAARNPRRYGAVIGLSGGLIGPKGTQFTYDGSLEETPVFIGCSDVDSHIPLVRVHESTAALKALGANVDERIYPGMGHTVNRDEIDAVQALLAEIAG